MEFDRPYFLLLLLLLPVLAWWTWDSLSRLTPEKLVLTGLLRGLAGLALILVLAGWNWERSSSDLSVVYLLDISPALSEEAAGEGRTFIEESWSNARRGDQKAVIEFVRDTPGRDPGDLGAALRMGLSMIDPVRPGRLVLLSDGQDLAGSSDAVVRELEVRGVPIDTVPLANPHQPEVLVRSVDLPQRVQEGEAFHVDATLLSNVETTAAVYLYRDQFLVAEKSIQLEPGETPLRFANQRSGEGTSTFEVEVVPEVDTHPLNNRFQATVVTRGKPRVLLADPDATLLEPVRRLLQAEGFETEVVGPERFPVGLSELRRFDLVILSDFPADYLSRSQMDDMARWVGELGGGLLVAGGEQSFSGGGYSGTPLERLLPVRFEPSGREDRPTVALMVILDRSGSMGVSVGAGQTKMSLANQGSALSMRLLEPQDYISVLAVDTRIHEVVPLGRVGDKDALEDRILSITAGGGGIYVLTSLVEARRQLQQVDAAVKHIILFGDSADAEEKYAGEMHDGLQTGGSALDLAASMAAEGITTSVVALGELDDVDTAWLRTLARRGGGRFFLTNDASELPRMFADETRKVAQSMLREEPIRARHLPGAQLGAGIEWRDAPFLLGYNVVQVRPAADTHLLSEVGDPLLTTWRFGLGQVGAWSSDVKPRWAGEWLSWSGFAELWLQTARLLARSESPIRVEADLLRSGDQLLATWSLEDEQGRFLNELQPVAAALYDDGQGRSAAVRQTGPGLYEASWPAPEAGEVLISFAVPDLLESPYLSVWNDGGPAEFRSLGVDEERLQHLAASTGGAFQPDPTSLFAKRSPQGVRRVDPAPWLLALAILLLPLELLCRRLPVGGGLDSGRAK